MFRLALGAEVSAPVSDEDTPDGSTTNRTGLAAQAVGNLKLKVGCPQFTAGTKVGIHAGALVSDG